MRRLLFTTTCIMLGQSVASAAVISQTFSMSNPTAIPDGDLSGLVQSITPATGIGNLDTITVTLETTGGWNGDLYAYLWHGGEISILVNRTGRTAGNGAGSATSGMFLQLDDAAVTDVHSAPGGFGSSMTGTFQPSARNVHPLTALDSSPRVAGLGVFTGDSASGEWRLYIADVASGDEANLTSWSIHLTGEESVSVPEPATALLGALTAFLTVTRRSRQRQGLE
jgi:subtilisin-like proprotein convertase family protein